MHYDVNLWGDPARAGLLHMTPPTYYMPPPMVPHVDAALAAFRALDGSDIPCTLQGMQPGDKVHAVSRELELRWNWLYRV